MPSLLGGRVAQRLARFFDVRERKLARLDEMRHQRLGAAAEQAEQLVDDLAMRGHLGDHRFEDVRVADLLRALQRVLRLEAIDDRLHGRVRGAALRREALLDLADRRRALRPKGLHDLELELAELRRGHVISYRCRRIYDKADSLASLLFHLLKIPRLPAPVERRPFGAIDAEVDKPPFSGTRLDPAVLLAGWHLGSKVQ